MIENFEVQDKDKLLTPGLLVFPDRVQHNIDAMIELAGGTNRLMPHVKTHKMSSVSNYRWLQEFVSLNVRL